MSPRYDDEWVCADAGRRRASGPGVQPRRFLLDAGLREGDTVVDYGCGPGYLTLPGAEIVGPNGMVYAVDVERKMVELVRKRASEAGLANMTAVLTDADATRLPDAIADFAICALVLHYRDDYAGRLALAKDMARLMRPGGRAVVVEWLPEERSDKGPACRLRGIRGGLRYGRSGMRGPRSDRRQAIYVDRDQEGLKMEIDWQQVDRWLVGEAWVESRIEGHINKLCRDIGAALVVVASGEASRRLRLPSRWRRTVSQTRALRSSNSDTWEHGPDEASTVESSQPIDVQPLLNCPPVEAAARVVDVGFGMDHEVEAASTALKGAIAIVNLAYEPFSVPKPLPERLRALAAAGAVAALVVEQKSGGRTGVPACHRQALERRGRHGRATPPAGGAHVAGTWGPAAGRRCRRQHGLTRGSDPVVQNNRPQRHRRRAGTVVAGRVDPAGRPPRHGTRLAGRQRQRIGHCRCPGVCAADESSGARVGRPAGVRNTVRDLGR